MIAATIVIGVLRYPHLPAHLPAGNGSGPPVTAGR